MKKEEKTIHDISIAFGRTLNEVRRQFELLQYANADCANAWQRLIKIYKRMRQKEHKSYISPYAKFDKMRKRK